MNKCKVAETTYHGEKIVIFIIKNSDTEYEIEALLPDKGVKVNYLPTMEQIILSSLYEKSKTLEEYRDKVKDAANRFEGIADE